MIQEDIALQINIRFLMELKSLKNKSFLITGGTGSFGQKFTETILKKLNPKRVVIYSRDEQKQYLMSQKFNPGNSTVTLAHSRTKNIEELF